MTFFEILLFSLALAADAFAAAVCKGLAAGKNARVKECLLTGAWFGLFQALMPLLGCFLGRAVASFVDRVDHWLAFFLLLLLGLGMIRSSFSPDEGADADFSFLPMLTAAFATSVDALAVGVTFAFTGTDIRIASVSIGITTLLLSAVGVKLGSLFAGKYQKTAERCGGAVLILLGARILAAGLA